MFYGFGYARWYCVSDADEILVSDIDADQLVQIDTYSRVDRSFGGFGYGAAICGGLWGLP